MMCGRCGDGLALVPVTEGPKKAKLCMDCTSKWQAERPDTDGTVPDVFQRFLKGDVVA